MISTMQYNDYIEQNEFEGDYYKVNWIYFHDLNSYYL